MERIRVNIWHITEDDMWKLDQIPAQDSFIDTVSSPTGVCFYNDTVVADDVPDYRLGMDFSVNRNQPDAMDV
jgi:hypothetical protein